MASKLIGRTVCPECGNTKAHVKIIAEPDGTPTEGKRHYRHCPDGDCGAQYFPRNKVQEQALLAKTRPEGSAPPNTTPPAAAAPVPAEVPPAPAAPAKKTKTVFGVQVPA